MLLDKTYARQLPKFYKLIRMMLVVMLALNAKLKVQSVNAHPTTPILVPTPMKHAVAVVPYAAGLNTSAQEVSKLIKALQ